MPLQTACNTDQKVRITVSPTTSLGNPANLDGPVVAIAVSGDGTAQMIDDRSFFVISGPTLGDSQFLVEGDADLGAGVQTISDLVTLTVTGALAANFGLTAGAPENK